MKKDVLVICYQIMLFYYQIDVTIFFKRTLALTLTLTLIIKNSIIVTKKIAKIFVFG